jgi:hypothetical protein
LPSINCTPISYPAFGEVEEAIMPFLVGGKEDRWLFSDITSILRSRPIHRSGDTR